MVRIDVSLPQYDIVGANRSELIVYPDGVSRILSMRSHYWDVLDLIADDGWKFADVISLALDMADDGPPMLSRDEDILAATKFVIAMALRIKKGLPLHSNDNDLVP